MKDNISPEEKLLRLIRGPKKQDVIPDKKNAPAAIKIKPETKKSIYSLIIQRYLPSFNIHKFILIVFIASLIYLGISLIYPLVGLKKIKLPIVSQIKITESKINSTQEIKPYEFYLKGISGRQIFGRSPSIEPEGKAKMQVADTTLNLIKDMNLIGIISGENPQAIIKDEKTQKTYYVTKGQFIGNFQIQDIQEGKVIISYNEQEFELYL